MKQRYTYLGLIIVILMGWIAAFLIYEAFVPTRYVQPESAEFKALRLQCENVDGLLSVASGPEGTDVSCYQGKKKVWWVRL